MRKKLSRLSFTTHLSCIIYLPYPCLIFLHDIFLPFSVPGSPRLFLWISSSEWHWGTDCSNGEESRKRTDDSPHCRLPGNGWEASLGLYVSRSGWLHSVFSYRQLEKHIIYAFKSLFGFPEFPTLKSCSYGCYLTYVLKYFSAFKHSGWYLRASLILRQRAVGLWQGFIISRTQNV